MPKGRMLSKKISQDEKVARLSLPATLLYTWIIPYLDVKGRIYADVWTLKAIVPNIKELTPERISKCVKEFEEAGLVTHYGDTQKYMEFNGFFKNQKVFEDRESQSEIPSPHEQLMSNSCATPEQVKESKVKISKVNSIVPLGTPTPPTFDTFKQTAIEKWNKFCELRPVFSKIKELSEKRRDKLKKRYGSESFRKAFEDLSLFNAIDKQPFLKGENDRAWKASFDWIIENDTNYLKIIELRYLDTGKR